MPAWHAISRNVKMSPRKARLVADLIRGKRVGQAFEILEFTPKRAAGYLKKTLKSATTNAVQRGGEALDADALVVSAVRVNEGPRLKRMFPRPRGMATPIARPLCHIHVEVSDEAR